MHKIYSGPAKVEFRDGEYYIVAPGSYVICAVSSQHIPLDQLRYWSVDYQEAYATPELAHARYRERLAGKTR